MVQTQRVAAVADAASASAPAPDDGLLDVSEVARQNLKKAANACRRYGWLSFWVQLVLNTVAAVVLLFSLAFTSQVWFAPCLALSHAVDPLPCLCCRVGAALRRLTSAPACTSQKVSAPCLKHASSLRCVLLQNGPSISVYLTLFGIVLGFLSLFWSFGYVRLSRKLRAFLDATNMDAAPKIRRSDVISMLEKVRVLHSATGACLPACLQLAWQEQAAGQVAIHQERGYLSAYCHFSLTGRQGRGSGLSGGDDALPVWWSGAAGTAAVQPGWHQLKWSAWHRLGVEGPAPCSPPPPAANPHKHAGRPFLLNPYLSPACPASHSIYLSPALPCRVL